MAIFMANNLVFLMRPVCLLPDLGVVVLGLFSSIRAATTIVRGKTFEPQGLPHSQNMLFQPLPPHGRQAERSHKSIATLGFLRDQVLCGNQFPALHVEIPVGKARFIAQGGEGPGLAISKGKDNGQPGIGTQQIINVLDLAHDTRLHSKENPQTS
jgi:hypothetical protein